MCEWESEIIMLQCYLSTQGYLFRVKLCFPLHERMPWPSMYLADNIFGCTGYCCIVPNVFEIIMELHVMLNIFPWEIFYLAHRATQFQHFLLRTWCYHTEHTRADVSEDFCRIRSNLQSTSFAQTLSYVPMYYWQPLGEVDINDCISQGKKLEHREVKDLHKGVLL